MPPSVREKGAGEHASCGIAVFRALHDDLEVPRIGILCELHGSSIPPGEKRLAKNFFNFCPGRSRILKLLQSSFGELPTEDNTGRPQRNKPLRSVHYQFEILHAVSILLATLVSDAAESFLENVNVRFPVRSCFNLIKQ